MMVGPFAARADGRDDAISTWVAHEFEPWRTTGGWSDVEQSFKEIVAFADSVYHFTINDGRVSFIDKNAEWSEPTHPAYGRWRALVYRAKKYRAFFENTINAFGIKGRAELAIDLDDLEGLRTTAPVIAFQKKRGSHRILVPDIDFLAANFYLSGDTVDLVPFDQKRDQAVFVGSTTGMLNISQHIIALAGHQRIRSAQYFRGNPDVIFELPNIVQCDGPDTEAAIRALGLGERMRPWSEQFGFRYILSLDGNGATCSRVVIALGSDGVLLKYESQNALFYFRGLTPWRHFVSICDDLDVQPAIAFMRARPGLASEIAAEATRFRSRYLSRIGLMTYTGEVLRRYIEMFGTSPSRGNGPSGGASFVIDTSGRFADGQDHWSTPGGWLRHEQNLPLLAVRLHPGPRLDDVLRWTSHHRDGTSSIWRSDEPARWPEDRDNSLIGFNASLSDNDRNLVMLAYEARFADGTSVGPVPSDSLCRAISGAPMTSLRIVTATR